MSPSRGAAAVQEAVPVFAALGDATRLSLLGRLSVEGPLKRYLDQISAQWDAAIDRLRAFVEQP